VSKGVKENIISRGESDDVEEKVGNPRRKNGADRSTIVIIAVAVVCRRFERSKL
jgi:hypothetical protein